MPKISSHFADFRRLKKIRSNFAEFELVKKFGRHFADLFQEVKTSHAFEK